MKKLLMFGVGLVWALAVGTSWAGMLGDTVRVQYFYPSLSNEYYPEKNDLSVVVGPGIEVAIYPQYDQMFSIDLSDNSIFMDYQQTSSWNLSSFNGIRFSEIDENITSVGLTTNISGLSASNMTFDGHSIQINWAGLGFNEDSFVQLDVNGTSPVPLPGAALLLGSGLTGLGIIRRKK